MKGKKYIGYSVEDLLHDQDFVSTVKETVSEEEWKRFLEDNIEAKENILRARKIIEIFRTTEGQLSEERKNKLWKNIHQFHLDVSRHRTIRFNKITTIAASILIILSLGGVLYMSNQTKNQYQFAETQNNLKTGNPTLVLSDGQKVELEKAEPKIAVLKNQNAIQINNDSIVRTQIPTDSKAVKTKMNEITVPYGKKSMLVLEDGTKVWLNAGSRFAFPQEFTGKKREVYLEGEGYFEVAKNANQPFLISTESIEVEVLGTKFNLSAYNSDNFSETVLLEGSVSISSKKTLFSNKVLMKPNQKATYKDEDKNIEVEEVANPAIYTSWVNGWYQFSNESLERVFNKLERYYDITFSYNKSTIEKTLPVSGKLDLKGSLAEVMEVLSEVAKFNYQINDNQVKISE